MNGAWSWLTRAEVVGGIIVGMVAAALIVAVAIARLRNGLQDDTIQSYKTALDAQKEETDAVRHELTRTQTRLTEQAKQITSLQDQVLMLTNMVTAKEDIASLRLIVEGHHRDDMLAHEKHEAMLRDIIALKGGTRSSETYDERTTG